MDVVQAALRAARWLKGHRLLAILLLAGALTATFARVYGLNETYEECMVTGMRGQAEVMLLNVERACDIRFGREIELDRDAVGISFSYSATSSSIPSNITEVLGPFPNIYSVRVVQSPSEFRLTRGQFRFFRRSCSDTVAQTSPLEKFLPYDATQEGFSFVEAGPKLECVQIEKVFGTHRRWWER